MHRSVVVERHRLGLGRALALTMGSMLFWGLAHAITGRLRTGLALLTLQAAIAALALSGVTAFRYRLLPLVVQSGWLMGLIVTAILIALLWAGVVISSYLVVRPIEMGAAKNVFAGAVVGVLCALIVAPFAYASRLAYVSRDVLTTLFAPGDGADDTGSGRSRVNFLLVGADAAANRYGARTDSVTVASVDTKTGRTVLFGLPRNLERVPLPAGPAHDAFPLGFTGDGTPRTPGLLNEVYQWAEDHPAIVPGLPNGQRGARLLKQTVGGILGIPIDYYAMVDMKGFAALIDAVGGVTVTIDKEIPYGRRGGVLTAGTHRLTGPAALWYGRSRIDSSDYVRMSRQKCLLNAVIKQTDPATVLRGFERIADAAKLYVSTDLPQSRLPALLELADKVKATQIESLQFVPPLISTASPDWDLIKQKVTAALAPRPAAKPRHRAPVSPARPAYLRQNGAVSLDATCP